MYIGQASLITREGVSALIATGYNYGASSIAHGSLVCIDVTGTDTDSDVQRRRRTNGVAVPASGNIHRAIGIAQGAAANRPLLANNPAEVCVGGLCQALIKVPASTAIAEDTWLIPSTSWDATNHVCLFNAQLEPLYQNLGAPAVTQGTVRPVGNPFAILRSAIASGSARNELAWVEVIPNRRPLWYQRRFDGAMTTAGLPIAETKALLFDCPGPGSIECVHAQLSTNGSGGGPTTVDVRISPKLATTDELSVLSALLNLAQNASAGFVYGAGCMNTGDTDSGANVGATDQGTLKALASRQFCSQAIIVVTSASINTGAVHLAVDVEGWLY